MTERNSKAAITPFTKEEKRVLINDLKRNGYLFPTNNEEWDAFEKLHRNTKSILPKGLADPDFLFESNEGKKSTSSLLKYWLNSNQESLMNSKVEETNDDFEKVVLAAEVAYQLHNEPTFGRVKFVKILYLIQEMNNMQLTTNYGKYAAGPLDPKLIYTIEKEFIRLRWFNRVMRDSSYGYAYVPLENVAHYKKYFPFYFSTYKDQIDFIISKFRRKTTGFCEIVATLFYVWKECLEKNIPINNSVLMSGFYGWNESKKKYSEEELRGAIFWMMKMEILPVS